MKSYFRSSGFLESSLIKTDSGNQLDLASVAPFLRTLLVMDGTVTKALESWFWEPVKVIPQNNMQANQDQILEREVLLRGEKSSRIFACARSSVSLDKLPENISSALVAGDRGIGELLREKGLESYRELFNINFLKENDINKKHDSLLTTLVEGVDLSSADSTPDSMIVPSDRFEIISRSYKIWINSQPAIIVTEYFPVPLYKASYPERSL